MLEVINQVVIDRNVPKFTFPSAWYFLFRPDMKDFLELLQ